MNWLINNLLIIIEKSDPYTMTKLTKNQLEHRKQFEGMTDIEIENVIPKIPVTLFVRKTDGNIGICIKSCPICGKRHTHSWNLTDSNEFRIAHCQAIKGVMYPLQYELILNWNYADNAKFKERYLQQVIDYERDPIAFDKEATKRQAKYHHHLLDKRIEKLMYGER